MKYLIILLMVVSIAACSEVEEVNPVTEVEEVVSRPENDPIPPERENPRDLH